MVVLGWIYAGIVLSVINSKLPDKGHNYLIGKRKKRYKVRNK